jgi:conjugative relaxase-like TrwC/TraI family protein
MFKLAKGTKEGALAYYGGADKKGYWRGRGAGELGLSGEVELDQFDAVLSSNHPQTGEFLLNRPNRERMACIDSLLAAPKSVSLLAIAMGDEVVIEAHRQAVDRAIEKLEEIAEAEHYSIGHRRLEKTGNLAIACFEHWDSRVNVNEANFDPHLHTHLVIANFTRRRDGHWRALRNSPFFKEQMMIGLSYQYHLARCLHKSGYGLEFKSNGTIDIGIDREIIEQFSRRSQHIEAEKSRLQTLGMRVGYGEIQRRTRKPKQAQELSWVTQEWAMPVIAINPLSEAQSKFMERTGKIYALGELNAANWQKSLQETSKTSALSRGNMELY